MRKKKARHKTSVHHLIPRSRCKELGLDPHDYRNKVAIDDDLHRRWHKLWDNRTPAEVIVILYDRLRAGEHFYPDNINFFGVYGTLSLTSAIQQTARRWAPPLDYYNPNLPYVITRLVRPARNHRQAYA